MEAEPCRVFLLERQQVVGISAGAFHSAAVTAAGCVFTWGRNQLLQLGHAGVAADVLRPEACAAADDPNHTAPPLCSLSTLPTRTPAPRLHRTHVLRLQLR